MKRKIFTVLLIAAFAVGTFIFPSSSEAWEKGSLKINPGLKNEGQWDSNIFYDPSDEKSDYIGIITPFINTELGFGPQDKHKLKVDYKVDLGMFAEFKDQNYGNHNLLGEVDFDLNDYGFVVRDNFLFTSSRAGTDQDQRNLRKENTIEAILSANFNKVSVDLGYSNFIVEYLSSTLKGLNHYDNSIWTTGYLQIQPKTKALLEYKYRNIQYPAAIASGRDGNAHSVMVGLTGDLTSKLVGTVKGGYKYQDYKNGDNYSAPVAEIGVDFFATERLDVHFLYNRDAKESSYANNNFYSMDKLTLSAEYDLGKKFVANAMGEYEHNSYGERAAGETKRRRDNLWRVGCGIDYNWKEWAVFGAGYRYTQRDSTIDSRDYDQHVFMLDSTLSF